jgi:hypothetical protein
MDIKSLTRDASVVKASRVLMPNGSVVTKTGCKILVPVRFEERKLAIVGVDNLIVGIYAMVIDDSVYAVSTINAMFEILPTSTNKIKIEGEEYYEFKFDRGATVFKTTELVKQDKLVYRIYDEIFSKGNIPWYLGYNDLAGLFDSARKHAGANVGGNKEVTELIVSLVGRSAKDKSVYYRQVVKSLSELETNPPAYIALRNVSYAPSNTVDKLAGSYCETGVISALNSPSSRVERIETLLRA